MICLVDSTDSFTVITSEVLLWNCFDSKFGLLCSGVDGKISNLVISIGWLHSYTTECKLVIALC
jgi:hypothetical protein